VKSQKQQSTLLKFNDSQAEQIEGKFKPFDEINTSILLKRIEEFENTDLSALPDSELMQLLSSIVSQVFIDPSTLQAGSEFYRTRRCDFRGKGSFSQPDSDLNLYYKTESEVWCAPPSVIQRGRLNQKGQQIFYACFDALAPIHEIRCEENDSYALMKYAIAPGMSLKMATIACSKAKGIFLPLDFVWTNKGIENWTIINRFIESVFYKKADDTEHYRVTIALSRMFDFPGSEGFIYPSVMRDDSFNVAIKPASLPKIKFRGLTYCVFERLDPERIGSEYFLRMFRLWSDKIDNGTILYHPISNCEIRFAGLGKPGQEIRYNG